jgi:hypothetical protein
MQYRVLRPFYERTGETQHSAEGKTVHIQQVRWIEVGRASSMQDAKDRFGGYPVLEAVGGHASA